ncbi:hypothetical protein [Microbispora rosea]|uniref:P-type ATPase n=1 Tax=Microbispora rosea TaxID=58117 RepID=UPI0034424CE1
MKRIALLAGTLGALIAGGVLHLLGAGPAGDALSGTVLALAPAAWWVASALRAGRLGVDTITVLALAGALAVREFLAGALIAVMLAGGRVLEDYALRRARRELTALHDRAPRSARRYEEGVPRLIGAEEVRRGDRLLVPGGELVPVDGVVESGAALLDELFHPVGEAFRDARLVRPKS